MIMILLAMLMMMITNTRFTLNCEKTIQDPKQIENETARTKTNYEHRLQTLYTQTTISCSIRGFSPSKRSK